VTPDARPRLLFVSPRFLFPLNEGGKIRTTGILRAMKGGAFDITLASPAPPDAARYEADIAGVADRFVSWPLRGGRKLARAAALLSPVPVSVATDASAAGRRVVAAQMPAADVLVADFPHSAMLLPDEWPAASIMFTHNVEAEILERHASLASGWRRLVWAGEARKMARFEGAALRRFASVIAVSARDAVALAARYELAHVPRIDTGVDLEFYRYQAPREEAGTVVFSGAMDSRSNIDGVEFLLRDVWPMVAAKNPEARMVVVGRNPPAALVAEAAAAGLRWEFTGTVVDIRPSLEQADVAVIPLRVGSGTRLKAFEAMACGLPVVSTTLGVEGLGLEPEAQYLAADSAEDFARAICRLLRDMPARRRLAQGGRELLEARYGWERIGRQFETICLDALERATR
jgi:glycosyltransferase involved in cell wall biosynthesis